MAEHEPAEESRNPPQAQPSSQVPIAPPTSPGPYVQPARESGWPIALGIIAIILGVVGIFGVFGQVVGMVMMHAVRSQPSPPPEWTALQLPMAWQITAGIANLVLAILVLACGIGLLKRRRWAGRGVIIWAIAHTLSVVTSLALSYTMMGTAMHKAQQDVAATGAPAGFMTGVMLASMCGGALFSLTPPVFTLIWFSRRKIKDEVATWR